MESNVTATYLARHLSDVLNRVRYQCEEFLVERNGEVVCRIVPAQRVKGITGAELARLWKEIPKPDPGYWDDLDDIVRNQPMEEFHDPWGR